VSGEAETVFRGRGGVRALRSGERRPSSGVEVESEPWGRARRSFPWRPRLDLAAVSLTLAGGTAVGAGHAIIMSGQSVEGRSDCGHFGLVD
jgi:hypothetical protein